MFLKHHAADPKAEEGHNKTTLQTTYLEAYRYSLELCNDPEIAHQVASLYLELTGSSNTHCRDEFAGSVPADC